MKSASAVFACLAFVNCAWGQCELQFMPAQDIAIGLDPRQVTTGDLNHDGKVDLAIISGTGSFAAMLGNGDGSFQSPSVYSCGDLATAIILRDLDGDGHLDCALSHWNSGDLHVRFGDGAGGFGLSQVYSCGTHSAMVDAGDFDSDGLLDLAVANDGSNSISVFRNTGNRQFVAWITLPTDSSPRSLVAADLDADGICDVALGNYLSHSVWVYRSIGSGFAFHSSSYLYAHPAGLVAGDLNGDGITDLAASNQLNSLGVLIGRQAPNAGSYLPASFFSTYAFPTEPRIADMNGDGLSDLIVTAGNSVLVLRGKPAPNRGTFENAQEIHAMGGGTTPHVADVDNDGQLDVLVAGPNWSINRVRALLNRSGSVQITSQPSSGPVSLGSQAALTIGVQPSPVSLQWRRAGVLLVDDGRVSGSSTPSLLVANFAPSDQGMYDCVVVGSCNTLTSQSVELSCRAMFQQQPVGATLFAGEQVTLTSAATSSGTVTYRWKKDGVNLFNSSVYAGVTTPMLTISPTDPTQSGTYTLAVTNACGMALSNPAVVVVRCRADFNDDGSVDFFDYLDFVGAFSQQLQSADMNGDSEIDFFDYLDFVARLSVGC